MSPPAGSYVLVVEDDADIREAVCDVLAAEGYTPVAVPDGAAALAYLRTAAPPAVILLDLMMPRMDGWAFLEARRTEPHLAPVPVVLVSAVAELDRVDPYAGIAAVLTKPFTPDGLAAVVARTLRPSAASPPHGDELSRAVRATD